MKTAGLTYSREFIGSGDRLLYTDANGRVRPFVGVPTHFHNTNSQSVDGFVTAGGTNYDKVWKTDGSGNPGWRAEAVGGSGTVTSVGISMPAGFGVTGSPVTGAGTLAVAYAGVAGANYFLGNTTGGTAPGFRAIGQSDVTNLVADLGNKAASIHGHDYSAITMGTSKLLGRNTAGTGAVQEISLGTGLSFSGTTLNGTVGVTSVGLTVPAGFSVSNSPITGSGTLAVAYAAVAGTNYFLANTTGGTAPAFRAMAEADIPSLNCSKIGTGYFPSARLATGSITSGNILFSDATNSYWNAPGASDARLKESIEHFRHGLDLILRLEPKQWRWNGLGHSVKGQAGVGFVAQENLATLGFCIFTNPAKLRPSDTEDTELYHLNQEPLISVLVNAVQELARRVEALEAR